MAFPNTIPATTGTTFLLRYYGDDRDCVEHRKERTLPVGVAFQTLGGWWTPRRSLWGRGTVRCTVRALNRREPTLQFTRIRFAPLF